MFSHGRTLLQERTEPGLLRRHARRSFGLVGLLGLLGCGGTAARPPSAAAVLALAPYFRELKTLRATAGSQSLTLLFDTGGGATLVTPEVAARLGCAPYGRDVVHRMSGERVEFQQCEAQEVALGSHKIRVEPLAVFDVNALLPAELPRLDGVLALDAFRGQVITLDWPKGRVVVHPPAEADRALREHGIPLRTATGETGRVLEAFVPITTARGPLWFLLDSGNLRGTLVSRHSLEENRLKLSAAGTLSIHIGNRPALALPAAPADLILDGALGTSFLMEGPLTLDLRTGAGSRAR